MRISVVIPAYNAAETIKACLASLYKQSLLPSEIIVVDNNSTDNTGEIVTQFFNNHKNVPSFYLHEKRQGPSFARNCGAKKASGDIIAFIDADCIAESTWLHNINKSFDNPKVGAVTGSIIGYEKDTMIGKFHALFTMRELPESRLFNEFNLLSGGFPTAHFSIKKCLFDEIGGFDEALPIYSEDYDLCARIYAAGHAINYNKKVMVFHQHRHSLTSTWRQSYGFGTGHGTLLKKHFHRMVIIEAPRFRYITTRWPLRIWLDMASADKKLILFVALSIIYWYFIFILLLFIILLYLDVGRRTNNDQVCADIF